MCGQNRLLSFLDTHPDIQPAHGSTDEEGGPWFSCLQTNNILGLVGCRLSCSLGINTEDEEIDCTGPVKLLCCKL